MFLVPLANLDWSSAALTSTAYVQSEHWQSKYVLAPLPFLDITICIGQTQVIREAMIWPVKFLWTEKLMLIQHVSICWASPGCTWFLTESSHTRSCIVLWSFLSTANLHLVWQKAGSIAGSKAFFLIAVLMWKHSGHLGCLVSCCIPLVPSPKWIVMSLLAVISWRLSFCASWVFFFFRTDTCKGALSAREQVFLNGPTQFFGMHPYIGSMIKHIPADSRTEIVVGIETFGTQGKLCHLCFLWGPPSRLKAHHKWWSWFLWSQLKGLSGTFHTKQKGCRAALLTN